MAQHKKELRSCPICLRESEYEKRMETCSRTCGAELVRRRAAERVKTVVPVSDIGAAILAAVKRGSMSIARLSELVDRSEATTKRTIADLKDRGHLIHLADDDTATIHGPRVSDEVHHHVVNSKWEEWHKFGVVGDNHLCNRHSRLDVLNALYDLYEAEGVTTVYNTGNYLEGEARFVRNELLVWGLDNQVDYFLEHYPQRKGIVTKFISGDDHEGWWTQREGIDIGRYVELRAGLSGRNDLVSLGYQEADIELRWRGGLTRNLRVSHPGGGSAYAISYKGQKYVESLQGGQKPHIVCQGHYHKFNVSYPREVWVIDTGCTCDQTGFMRKKHIQAHVGGVICGVRPNADGSVWRVRPEFIPFYDLSVWSSRGTAE